MNAILHLLVPALLACAGSTLDLDAKGQQKEPEVAAVEQAARDYVEGFFASDLERIERGVHPSLRKVTLQPTSWGAKLLNEMDRQGFLELSRVSRGREATDSDEITVEVLGVSGSIASVRIDCAQFLDYAHLVRINDEWKIISLLSISHGQRKKRAATAEEREKLEKAVFEYVDGYYALETERMAGALHPRLRRVTVESLPNGRELPRYSTPEFHIEAAKAKKTPMPPKARKIEIVIHDANVRLATVTVDSALQLEYLHLVKLDGEWKIVNEAWNPKSAGQRGAR